MQITQTISYTTNIDYKLEYYPLSDKCNISHFANGNTAYVIRLTTITAVTGAKTEYSSKTITSVVQEDYLQQLIKDPSIYSDRHSIAHHIFLLKKTFKQDCRLYGSHMSNLGKLYGVEQPHISKYISDDQYAEADNSEYEFIQIVKDDIYVDCNGELFTAPFVLNDCVGQLTNKNYHLDEYVDYLITQSNVAFIIEPSYRKQQILACPIDTSVDNTELQHIISDIASYNESDDEDETINLVYYPTSDEIKKFKDLGYFYQEQFIIDKILNGQQFKVNPKPEESVYGKRKFKR